MCVCRLFSSEGEKSSLSPTGSSFCFWHWDNVIPAGLKHQQKAAKRHQIRVFFHVLWKSAFV